jgi:hypothetical protein
MGSDLGVVLGVDLAIIVLPAITKTRPITENNVHSNASALCDINNASTGKMTVI